MLKKYIAQQLILSPAASGVTAIRDGRRAILSDDHGGYSLGKYLTGQLPIHYRSLDGISSDFSSGNSHLEALLGMIAPLPTVASFKNSHCGEITAAQFVEDVLGYSRLYSKLTMTTSANTNAHKMDGLFVNTSCTPFEFLFVEAKSSILPTTATKTKTHRSGILTSMVNSLNLYDKEDPRFEYARIRDNLSKSFNKKQAAEIRKEMTPPGPENLKFLGISVTNLSTINPEDDDFILTEHCATEFDYYALVVTDLAGLAEDAYGRWEKIKAAAA